MRVRDWSSHVCSSDLRYHLARRFGSLGRVDDDHAAVADHQDRIGDDVADRDIDAIRRIEHLALELGAVRSERGRSRRGGRRWRLLLMYSWEMQTDGTTAVRGTRWSFGVHFCGCRIL